MAEVYREQPAMNRSDSDNPRIAQRAFAKLVILCGVVTIVFGLTAWKLLQNDRVTPLATHQGAMLAANSGLKLLEKQSGFTRRELRERFNVCDDRRSGALLISTPWWSKQLRSAILLSRRISIFGDDNLIGKCFVIVIQNRQGVVTAAVRRDTGFESATIERELPFPIVSVRDTSDMITRFQFNEFLGKIELLSETHDISWVKNLNTDTLQDEEFIPESRRVLSMRP